MPSLPSSSTKAESEHRELGGDRLVGRPTAVTAADRRVFAARRRGRRMRRVVLAEPPALTGRIAMTPAMPLVRDALVEGMPMAPATKINVV
jgi:monoamine oxidase